MRLQPMWDSTLLSREARYLPSVADGQRRNSHSGKGDGADYGIALFDRLRQLKAQKEELEERRGVIFRDSNVENAILIVDAEIEKVEGELARVARKTGNGKTK